MNYPSEFTFTNLRIQFEEVLKNGYSILTCEDYIDFKKNIRNIKILVNRVDIDLSCRKAKILADLYNKLGIKATFFVRLHADEYNPFSFENYKCLKFIKESGHEIGYHSEIIDQSAIWNEDAAKCLIKDIKTLNTMLGIEVKGVASHGGLTGLNNLDFWKNKKPSEFGLLYEAYDKEPEFGLFYESFYVSDSNYRWKCYNNGQLVEGDRRNIAEHSINNHPVMYTILHPETYFHEHIYE
jgi:hypothetical protein